MPEVMPLKSTWRQLVIDGLRRLSALACLGCTYQFAVTSFDARWLFAAVVTALPLAVGKSHWSQPGQYTTDNSSLLCWPSGWKPYAALLPAWVLLTGAAILKAGGSPPQIVLWTWIAGVAWLLLGSWTLSQRDGLLPFRIEPSIWWWGLLVVAFAAVLRLWAIDSVPRYVHCDEGTTIMIGQAFFANPDRDWFSVIEAGSYTTMSLCYALVGWAAYLFGFGLVPARLPDVLLGIASVALLFDGLRRVSTLRLAVVGSLLLAANHCHIHYSRIASSYIETAFVVSLCFAVWSRVWAKPSFLNASFLGVVTALGAQTYRASMVAGLLLLFCMLLLTVMHWGRHRSLLVSLAVMWVGCVTTAAPFGVALWQQGGQVLGRARYLNVVSEHMLPILKNNVYFTDSTFEVLVQQSRRSLLGFHKGRDHQPQYEINSPMADRYTAALMVAGLVIAIVSLRHFIVPNALVFTVGYLLLGLGMQWAPGFNRTTGALPLGMVFPAIALVQCWGTLLGSRMRAMHWLRDLLIAASVALCIAANLRIYFFDYSYSRAFGDSPSEVGWVARKYASQYTIHLVNWPLPGPEGLHLILGDLPVTWHDERDAVAYVHNARISGMDLFIIHGHDLVARDAALARFPNARLVDWRPHPSQGPNLFLVFVENR